MENNIKIMLSNIFYDELNLKEIETDFKKIKIIPKEKSDELLGLKSDYFMLLNDLHLENLTEEERKQLNELYTDYVNNQETDVIRLYTFLKNNKLKLLLPKEKGGITYYGPVSPNYSASNDTIVLGFNFVEFDENNPITDDQYEYVCNRLNCIEEELSKQNNIKITVIEYNEMPLQVRTMI